LSGEASRNAAIKRLRKVSEVQSTQQAGAQQQPIVPTLPKKRI
jgi:hypothetical protein